MGNSYLKKLFLRFNKSKMSKEEKTRLWAKTRKFFNDIHLWVGLASGIIIIAICLSGTIYVYNNELREMAAQHLHQVVVPEDRSKIPVDELMDKIRDISGGDVSSLSIMHEPSRTYQFSVRKEGDKSRFGTTYFVNPYTAEITGDSNEENSVAEFMGYMFSLHRWLLLDKIEEPIFGDLPNRKLGSYVSGSATILFTIGVITGLIIWFPRKVKNWKQGLKIKWGGSWKRTNHDLHNSLAFYSIIFLFLMGITGPQWSFPWYRTALQKTLAIYKEELNKSERGGRPEAIVGTKSRDNEADKKDETISTNDGDTAPLSIEAYLSSADIALAYDGDYRISFPKNGNEPIEISKKRIGFFAPAASDKLTLNPVTGEVISTEIFRDKPFNERVGGSIKALHMGDVYGSFTKLLYFISCLIATTLPITGTLIWINKWKKKPKSKKTLAAKTDEMLA